MSAGAGVAGGAGVSVVIPTLNAGGSLGGLLEGLAAQTLRPLEVIVIDSSSGDGTMDIARAASARTIGISREDFNHGTTRTLAARAARGNVLVFMAQDALPFDETLLQKLTAPLARADVAASYARQVPYERARPLERFSRSFNYPPEPCVKGIQDTGRLGIKAYFMSNACSAVRRGDFFDAGGFPETPVNEDMLLAARLMRRGLRVAYEPGALVYHSHDYPPLTQFRRYFDIGVFMSENGPLFDGAAAGPEGLRFVGGALKYMFAEGRYLWVPYVFFDAVARYSGYRLGRAHRALPRWLGAKLGLQGSVKRRARP